MTKYLAGVLTAIAAGVLLVAYALLGPRTSASMGTVPYAPYMQPLPGYPQQPAMTHPPAYPATAAPVPVSWRSRCGHWRDRRR